MKTNWKLRILSIFLAASLVIGMAPVRTEAKNALHITCYKDAVSNENKLFKKEIKPQVSFGKNNPYYKDLKWMISEWYTYISGKINYLKLKLEIPESIQEEYYLDEVQMNAGSNDKKGTFTRSVTVSPDMMNTSTEIEMEIYQSDKKKTPPGGLNIDPIFKKNQATYALYNKPIIDNNIVDEDGSWMSLWEQTDIQGVSRNPHAAKNNVKVWSEPDSYGGIRCTNKDIIDKAIYGGKSLSELEKAITKELKEKAETGDEELNPSFIEPLKSGKIVAKVNRLSNCDDSIHVDFGMWDIAQNDWFDNKYKVDFKVQDEYKASISFKDFFEDKVCQDFLMNSNLVCGYGYEIALPRASADANAKKYRFMGWKTEKYTDNFIDLSKRYKITEDTTFVAYFWETCTIKYEMKEGFDNLKNVFFNESSLADKTVDKGSSLSIPNSTKDVETINGVKYTFEGWKLKGDNGSLKDLPTYVSSDITLVAVFNKEVVPTKPEDDPKPGTDPTKPEDDPKPGTDPTKPEDDPKPGTNPAPNTDPSTPPVIIEPIDNPVVIPEEEAPLAEVIEEEDTPLSAPIEEEEAVLEEDEEGPVAEVVAEDVEIEDEAAPLSDMPKTREVSYLSGLTITVVGITALGALLLLAGKIFRRR